MNEYVKIFNGYRHAYGIDRIGQESPMTYIDIMAEDTIDDKIVVALRKKVDIASQIMGEELKDWI